MDDISDLDYDSVPVAGEPEPAFKFPSAENWTGVDEDWKPTLRQPVPTFRCYYIKPNGEQCKKFALAGTGLNGTNPVCMIHGGRLPAVKAHAEAVKDAVRMRLIDNTDVALDTIIEIIKNPNSPAAVRLKASTEVLDRAGIRAGTEVSVEVEMKTNPAEEIAKRLATIAENLKPKAVEDELIDEGEQDAQEVPEVQPNDND